MYLYKYWYLFTFKLKARSVYFLSTVFWVFSQIMTLFFVILVWTLSNRSDTNEILNYVLIGNIFFALTGCSAAWSLAETIQNGKITSKLLYPSSTVMYYFCNGMVTAILYGVSTLIFIIPFSFFYWNIISINPLNLLWLIPWVIIGILIRFFCEFIIGCSTFWFRESNGIVQSYMTILPMLCGSLIPYNLLSKNFHWLIYTPFAFTFHHPLQILLGKYSAYEIILTFAGGIFWIIVLFVLAKLSLKKGMKKNEAVGL